MIALIDADSMVYVLAYNHREHTDVSHMKMACDDFLKSIITLTYSTHYMGVFSPEKNFRHDVYKYAKYKGQRREKSDYQRFWEPIIKEHYTNVWGFVTPKNVEADDVICYVAENYHRNKRIICSPDKDLRQIEGSFYDYNKNEFIMISEQQAHRNLCTQLLIGDATDNIKGVPKCGPAAAEKLFKDQHPITWFGLIASEYVRCFGDFYGDIIFKETLAAVKMLSSSHLMCAELLSAEQGMPWTNPDAIKEYVDKTEQDIRLNLFQKE